MVGFLQWIWHSYWDDCNVLVHFLHNFYKHTGSQVCISHSKHWSEYHRLCDSIGGRIRAYIWVNEMIYDL